MIRETLRHAKGDKSVAAQLLGISTRTIYRKLDGIEDADPPPVARAPEGVPDGFPPPASPSDGRPRRLTVCHGPSGTGAEVDKLSPEGRSPGTIAAKSPSSSLARGSLTAVVAGLAVPHANRHDQTPTMKLDKLLKRHFWVVISSFVAAAAFFTRRP